MNRRHLAIGVTVALVLGAFLLWANSAYTQGSSSPRLASLGDVPVPHLINYQGRLTDRQGRPQDGDYFMRFCIYDVASGGTALWCDPPTPGTWRLVEVKQGVFSVLLGDEGETNPIPPAVFDETSSDRWLGVKIFPDTEEMDPRRRIASVGYAYRAEDANRAQDADNADTVDGIHASSTATANTLLALDSSGKFTNTVLYTGHGKGLDADLLDGQHGSYYLDWNNLTNMPAGFADGVDNVITYTAGTGLSLSDTEFSITTTYRLPQSCSNGQIAKWNGTAWVCDGDVGIPSGMIGMFDTDCPSGWTRVAALDNKFPMGGATYGTTGGSSTHTHTGTTDITEQGCDPSSTPGDARAVRGHWHSFTTDPASSLPPYITVVFCRKD
jgi:hypothetical protein